jgi:hypothetical protein
VDWLTDIVRLLDLPLAMILGASPVYLPVVGASWSVLPRPLARRGECEAGKTE